MALKPKRTGAAPYCSHARSEFPVTQSLSLQKYSKVLTTLVLAVTLSAASADNSISKLNKLKASYLLNFMTFIDWPSTPENNPYTPLSICLQDATPFDPFLRGLITIKPEPKRELYVTALSAATHCDLTYFYSTPAGKNSVVEGSVVVLSSDRVSQKDAAIIFYLNNDKLRFEIVMSNVRKSGVTISSELLKIAKITQ